MLVLGVVVVALAFFFFLLFISFLLSFSLLPISFVFSLEISFAFPFVSLSTFYRKLCHLSRMRMEKKSSSSKKRDHTTGREFKHFIFIGRMVSNKNKIHENFTTTITTKKRPKSNNTTEYETHTHTYARNNEKKTMEKKKQKTYPIHHHGLWVFGFPLSHFIFFSFFSPWPRLNVNVCVFSTK